jgi:hypothetical protein
MWLGQLLLRGNCLCTGLGRRSVVTFEGNHQTWSVRSWVRWVRPHRRLMSTHPPRFKYVCSFPAPVHGPSVGAML